MGAPKYVLLSYDEGAESTGEHGYEETWALCQDAADLFADPPPPTRGTYELLGCAPEGDLLTALARARADGSAPLGPLTLETLDKAGGGEGEWRLEDVRVVADRPCARDLSLRDVTVEGTQSDDNPYDCPQCPPLSPGYRILGADGEPWGGCRDLAHVQEDRPEQLEPSLRLLGCSPRGALRAALDGGEEDLGHVKVVRIDTSGRPVQPAAEGELRAWIPSARGPGLVDLTLDPWTERPPLAAREVWELWGEGRPSVPNRWADCDAEGRRFWLDTALANHTHTAPDRPPATVYHLDGSHITDAPGFFCALGEAVNGPAGYFGWGLDALNDCLRGSWGATPPFTLVWHDTAIARACLGVTPHTGRRPPTFEELLAFLTERHVEVRLA
ncbi:barstar family protein [Streptomyces sp. NBC_00343]|uniref:barstar family protein n=1 Tax=Streptomyces sp. NBC_00343 TaxID=2975719 RepID=UPI002E281B42|nr:barstar family protein [Streptomyces sp. NBC_00343]